MPSSQQQQNSSPRSGVVVVVLLVVVVEKIYAAQKSMRGPCKMRFHYTSKSTTTAQPRR